MNPDSVGNYRAPSLQDPTYRSNYPANGYRYPDYKPVPPPKSAAYKPVPPPKPKSSNGHVNEGNYMNNNGGYAPASSLHYHSSNINNKPVFMNGNTHRYGSEDVDSGQGSSLDRDYGLYNNYPKAAAAAAKADQYYYNLPSHQHNGNSPPRRDGLDLTNNREYRGSAFELYKKPLSEARPPTATSPPQHHQYYSNQQSVAR